MRTARSHTGMSPFVLTQIGVHTFHLIEKASGMSSKQSWATRVYVPSMADEVNWGVRMSMHTASASSSLEDADALMRPVLASVAWPAVLARRIAGRVWMSVIVRRLQ